MSFYIDKIIINYLEEKNVDTIISLCYTNLGKKIHTLLDL